MTDRTIGHFELLGEIGRGGMGVVYRARDTKLGRIVALKQLNAEHAERLGREARAIAALNHPNICTLHEVGDGYLVMEFVEGVPLAGPMTVDEARRIGLQIVAALAAAHAEGIVHRDLKPANVMVTPDGRAKVLDFGLAKRFQALDSESDATQSLASRDGVIQGTVCYMSPEQAQGKPVDARSDQFAFGLVLHEMLTGERAFQGDSAIPLLAAILKDEPKPLGREAGALAAVIARCLKKDPAQRYATTNDLRAALEIAPTAATPRWRIAAAVTLALAAAILAYWQWPSARPQPTLTIRPITNFPGTERYPSFSPDAKQVVYVWSGENVDHPDVFTQLVAGSAPLRLTNNSDEELFPQFSPDANQIAFVRGGDVFTVPALGGEERRIGAASRFVWSPNGKYVIAGLGGRLTRLPALGGEPVPMPGLPDRVAFWRVSPDGKTLAVALDSGGASREIRVFPIDADGALLGAGRAVPEGGPDQIVGLNWLPDSTGLLIEYSGTRAPLFQLPLNGVLAPFTTLGENAVEIGSHASGGLVFGRRSTDHNLHRFAAPAQPGTAGSQFTVANSTWTDDAGSIAPDGLSFVFQSDRSGNPEIWLARHDGTGARQLTAANGEYILGSPSWSPDSQTIVYDGFRKGITRLFTVSAAGGPARELPTPKENSCFRPSFSADGTAVLFGMHSGGADRIWRMTLADGHMSVVAEQGREPRESADGKWVYLAEGRRPGVWRVRSEGGHVEKVTDNGIQGAWALTPRALFVADRDTMQLTRIDLSTGLESKVFALPSGYPPASFTRRRVDVSRDESWYLFTLRDQFSWDVMIAEDSK
jgi:serine/threonine protein kinase